MCMITPDEFGTSSAFALESTKDLLFGILVKLSVIVVPSLSLNPERRRHYSAEVKFSRMASLSSSTLLRSPKVCLILYL
jgi:hypothetical protein